MQIAGWLGRALRAALVVCLAAGSAAAQGVTTGSMAGVVKDGQDAVVPGATVIAIHEPSGTSYEAVTQGTRYRIVFMGTRPDHLWAAAQQAGAFVSQPGREFQPDRDKAPMARRSRERHSL